MTDVTILATAAGGSASAIAPTVHAGGTAMVGVAQPFRSLTAGQDGGYHAVADHEVVSRIEAVLVVPRLAEHTAMMNLPMLALEWVVIVVVVVVVCRRAAQRFTFKRDL